MTTPQERTRTIRQTREFLHDLSVSEGVSDGVRIEAGALLKHYPVDADLDVAAQGAPCWWASTKDERALSWAEKIGRRVAHALQATPATPGTSASPAERTQAVISACTFLMRLRYDPEQSDAIRREAVRLLRHYPWNSDLVFACHAAPAVWGAPATKR